MSLCMLWALTKWGAVNNIFIYILHDDVSTPVSA